MVIIVMGKNTSVQSLNNARVLQSYCLLFNYKIIPNIQLKFARLKFSESNVLANYSGKIVKTSEVRKFATAL